MLSGRFLFVFVGVLMFGSSAAAADDETVCHLYQKPPGSVEVVTEGDVEVVLWGYSKRSIHRMPHAAPSEDRATTWELAEAGSILADAASRQCGIWIMDQHEQIHQCEAPNSEKAERLESKCADMKLASSKRLKSKPIRYDVDPGTAPWHRIPVQNMLRLRFKVADLSYRKIKDTGKPDPSEPRYWDGSGEDSVDVDIFSVDWVAGDWSQKTMNTNGRWHDSPKGRWLLSGPAYEDKAWSWLLPRAWGPTFGAGLRSEKEKGERQIDVFLKYGVFLELTDFLAFEAGRLTGIAVSGDFNDRTDSAVFWGFRLDGVKLAKLLIVDLWR